MDLNGNGMFEGHLQSFSWQDFPEEYIQAGGVNENQQVETRCTPDAPVSGCPFFGGGKPQKKNIL